MRIVSAIVILIARRERLTAVRLIRRYCSSCCRDIGSNVCRAVVTVSGNVTCGLVDPLFRTYRVDGCVEITAVIKRHLRNVVCLRLITDVDGRYHVSERKNEIIFRALNGCSFLNGFGYRCRCRCRSGLRYGRGNNRCCRCRFLNERLFLNRFRCSRCFRNSGSGCCRLLGSLCLREID